MPSGASLTGSQFTVLREKKLSHVDRFLSSHFKKTYQKLLCTVPKQSEASFLFPLDHTVCARVLLFSDKKKQSIAEETITCLNKDRNSKQSRQSGESPLRKYCTRAIKHLKNEFKNLKPQACPLHRSTSEVEISLHQDKL